MLTQRSATSGALTLLALLLLAQTSLGSGAHPAGPIITAAPALHLLERQLSGSGPCSVLGSISSSCAVETPRFLTLDVTEQAQCYCYEDRTFNPDNFDTAFVGCLSFLETADPSLYESLSGSLAPSTPCEAILGGVTTGPVDDSTTTTFPRTSRVTSRPTSTRTSSSDDDSDLIPACTTFRDIYASCTAATSDFTDLPFTQQASCVCYDGSSYNPTRYDGAFNTCASFLDPSGTSLGDRNPTPCADAGAVRGNADPVSSTTPGGRPVNPATVTSTSTGGAAAAMMTGSIDVAKGLVVVGMVQIVRVLV